MNLPKLRFKDNDGKAFPDWEWPYAGFDVGRISRANNTDSPSCLSSGRGVIRRTCGVPLPYGGLRRTETPCYPKHKRLVRLIRPTALYPRPLCYAARFAYTT